MYFEQNRERFAHAYILEALEIWNSMGFKLKVKMLKDRYSEILEVALFNTESSGPSNYMSGAGSSSRQPSNSSGSRSGPVSLVSTGVISSSSSNSASDEVSGGGKGPV